MASGFRLRGLWRDIHLWIGAGLFVVLAPLGLTGTLLIWEDGLDKLVHPARYAVHAGTLAPQTYLDAANRAFAGRAVIAQLRIPDETGLPVTVNGFAPTKPEPGQRPPGLTAWIDPGTGTVIAVADPRQELRGIIHRIHGNMLLPVNGRPVVGWLGVLMLISCVTGLCIWWPRNNALLLKALRWTRSPSVFSNVHHMVGFWICVPLAVLSLSGAYIAFPQQMRAIFAPKPADGAKRAGGEQRGGFSPPLAMPQQSADQALAAALAADDSLAGAKLVSMTLPTQSDKPAWRLQLKPASGPPVTVRVSDASGKAKLQDGPPQGGGGEGGGDPIARTLRKLHDGSGFGPVWTLIAAVTGLAPTLLGLTGIVVWLRSLRRKPID